ncbi:hypothetical protein CIB87_09235 [Priestia megaterium]|uniref:Uncharacterized protein n=1 Tax=Priestia megaterium TaxID=1404 RepID=A0AA86LV66_PRIMG|nr:hypothetical protein [Priestia megaterium]AXI29187.1 hypothetical protein CIB87_09235 [Priestia megaterium]
MYTKIKKIREPIRECLFTEKQVKELLKVIESIMMDYINYREEKNAENSKEETAVKPEKKTNERELNKKSESQQIQDEQKDLRAYATKVEVERLRN